MTRTLLITGASGGLAQAIIQQLPERDHLILLGRSQTTLASLYAHRPNTTCLALDITNPQAIKQMLTQIAQQYRPIDILINNAGYGTFKAFDEFSSAETRQMFAVNTFASIDFARIIGTQMAERGHGHIVNIVSMAGLIASTQSTVYSASKFALIGYSNALRLELARKNVFVTTVNPGPIATTFFDHADATGNYLQSIRKFILTPEQVASRIVQLLGTNQRELNLPLTLAAAHKLYTLLPKLSDWLTRKIFNIKAI